MINERVLQTAKVFLRLSLSAAFLSAIGDRFGLWGRYGGKNVSWGDWAHFLQFVAYLNPFMPKALIPTIGVVETALEFTLALALLGGVLSTHSRLGQCRATHVVCPDDEHSTRHVSAYGLWSVHSRRRCAPARRCDTSTGCSCPCGSRFGGRFRARLIPFGEYQS